MKRHGNAFPDFISNEVSVEAVQTGAWCWSAGSGERAAPFCVEPGKNAQGANLYRAWRHDRNAPQFGVVHGRNVHRPDGSSGGDQAGYSLFPLDAQGMVLPDRLDSGRLGRGDIGNDGPVDVALAPLIPIDVIASM